MWVKNVSHWNWYTGGIIINMEEVIKKLEKKQRYNIIKEMEAKTKD